MRRFLGWRWLWGCGFVLALLLGGACQQRILDQGKAPERSSEEEVLALLSVARSHHRRAQLLLKLKKSEEALAEMDRLLALRFPKNFRPGAEAILDGWARKANMLLQLHRPQEALQAAQEGIRRSPLQRSFYLAHLYHVKGQVLEALERKREALEAYQRSIAINEEVIRHARKQMKGISPRPRGSVQRGRRPK